MHIIFQRFHLVTYIHSLESHFYFVALPKTTKDEERKTYSCNVFFIARFKVFRYFQFFDQVFRRFWQVGWLFTLLRGCVHQFGQLFDFPYKGELVLHHRSIDVEELGSSGSLLDHNLLQVGSLLVFQCLTNIVRHLIYDSGDC